jgi:hypothetical protein
MAPKKKQSKKPVGTVERLPLYLMDQDRDNLQKLLDTGRFENKAAAVRWALRVAGFIVKAEKAGDEVCVAQNGGAAHTRLVLL